MLSRLPARDKLVYTWLENAAKLLPFFLLVFITQWPFRHVPFFYDSLGYVIVIADYMRHYNTILPLVGCDPGHPPLAFLVLALNWEIFGDSVVVSHATQWFWASLLLAGFYRLMLKAFGLPKLWAAGAALLLWVHPFTFSLAMQLIPDVAMAALFLWTLSFYYEKRKAAYCVLFALTMLSKANAAPLLLIFCIIEFLLLPGARIICGKNRRAIIEDRLVWINYTALGTIPYLVWLVIHKVYNGFWYANQQFQTSFVFDWSLSNLYEQLRSTILWGIWWKEGHRVMVTIIFLVFVVALLTRRARTKGETSHPEPAPVYHIAFSFAIQAILVSILYCAKELRLFRFFYPVVVLVLPILMMVLYHSYQILRSRARKPVLVSILFCGLFALLAANFVIRWHPFIVNKTFGESRYLGFLRNTGTIGYDMNLEILPALAANRLAAQHLQRIVEESSEPPVIVSSYPFTQALNYPIAGYVDRPIPNYPFDNLDSYFTDDWDYFVLLPDFQHLRPLLDDSRFAEIAEVDATFRGTWDSWNYEVVVYRRNE